MPCHIRQQVQEGTGWLHRSFFDLGLTHFFFDGIYFNSCSCFCAKIICTSAFPGRASPSTTSARYFGTNSDQNCCNRSPDSRKPTSMPSSEAATFLTSNKAHCGASHISLHSESNRRNRPASTHSTFEGADATSTSAAFKIASMASSAPSLRAQSNSAGLVNPRRPSANFLCHLDFGTQS